MAQPVKILKACLRVVVFKVWSGSSGSNMITWDFVKDANSRPHTHKPTELGNWVWDPVICTLTCSPSGSDACSSLGNTVLEHLNLKDDWHNIL